MSMRKNLATEVNSFKLIVIMFPTALILGFISMAALLVVHVAMKLIN